MKYFYLLLLTYFIQPSVLYAQDSLPGDSLSKARFCLNQEYNQLYKENSDFSYTSPRGEVGAPSKYVINGKLTTNYLVLGTGNLPVAFSIIPDFTVRVRNEKSAGVRTPSFRLGGTFYLRLAGTFRNYKYGTLSFTHHSNGQDGEALNPDQTINTRTGNFNTNYLTASYHFGTIQESSLSQTSYSLNHSAGLEWHKWFNYEKILEGGYGFTRLNYNFSWRRYQQEKEHWRLNAESSYAVNPIPAYRFTAVKKRLNAELSFHYAFPFMDNVFLMATAGYYGEDPYNIYYRDKYAFVRFGISSGFVRHKSRDYDR